MDRFARQITWITLGGSTIVFAFAVLLRGYAVSDAFMAVVGLAVARAPPVGRLWLGRLWRGLCRGGSMGRQPALTDM